MIIFQSSMIIDVTREVAQRFPLKRMNILSSYGVDGGDENELLVYEKDLTGLKMADCGTFSLHEINGVATETTSYPG